MRQLTFYEQVGVVTPGAVFLFGLMFYTPELRDILAKGGISVGGLGVFVILSYAGGHLLAALGNIIEEAYWNAKGGMPSDWIIGPKPALLSAVQVAKVEDKVSLRLGLVLRPFDRLTRGEWFPIFRQIHSDVEKHGNPDRGNVFNGIYGLNRGLCSASVALAVTVVVHAPMQWPIAFSLVLIGGAYLYRMHRFGVHYAREIYDQFLLLPDQQHAKQV